MITILLAFLPRIAKIFHFILPSYYRTIIISEADSTINLDSSSVTSSLTTKKSKKYSSPVYEFTRVRKDNEPEKDEKGNKLLYCTYCEYLISVIINLRRHL